MTLARIDQDSPRLPLWMDIFGSDFVPVKSFVPTAIKVDGKTEFAYLLDVGRLTGMQRRRLEQYVAGSRNLSPEEVGDLLCREGMPILSRDVSVTSDEFGLLTSAVETVPL